MQPRLLKHFMNVWPPFAASGIHVAHLADDWSVARVTLRLRRWNRNYVGTHFGGNLFKMCDPFWMLLAMERLGHDYIVWDKAGEIEFVAPGRETVHAEFVFGDALRAEAVAATDGGDKFLRWYENDITTADGTVIARVRKQLYIRRKRRDR
ncbi:DUF4442 domain-containing protein [Salinisphaera hydrothermalis]|uniref:DUF4442 domain-containing protein n=1 Tax=Salinisphaera hydrothermalis TaxID=563188 RepID=UPI003341C144